ncbi:MAG: acetoin utilization protein AcuC [Candidatus Lokiarchaeota archaeon]|nr:acetoin utilization protein AcuC [Candidatus Lokiarchaeota archaeon]
MDKVGFIYTEDYYKYNFGKHHPLQPVRLELTYKLMESYGLLNNSRLEIRKPKIATREELYLIHDKEYVDAVKKYSDNPQQIVGERPNSTFGMGSMDNPVFPGMFEASSMAVGASITAAEIVMEEENEISTAFNIAGGLHHAMRNLAHGFCIFNDVSIAIQKIRVKYPDLKVMYLDVDAHHGDGVQAAFYDDPEVLTLSIHQDGHTLFPGTGFMEERGRNRGKGYSINFPLYPGTYDSAYIDLFRTQVPSIMKRFQPDVLFTQLGVDTYFADPLTQLGLSTSGHYKIFNLLKEYSQNYAKGRWIAMGGGGYLMGAVPRSWTLALSVMLEEELPNAIPLEWITFFEQKHIDEPTPYELRDMNYRVEEQILKNPMFSVRIEERIDAIEKYVVDEVLPNL